MFEAAAHFYNNLKEGYDHIQKPITHRVKGDHYCVQHVVCRNVIDSHTFSKGFTSLVFDSCWNSCTDEQVHDCILNTHVLPKVCFDVVFSYLPNIIMVDCFRSKYFSEIIIYIGSASYRFTQCRDQITPNLVNDHLYMNCYRLKNYNHVIKCTLISAKYNRDHDIFFMNVITSLFDKYGIRILDCATFLNIIGCLMQIQLHLSREYISTPSEQSSTTKIKVVNNPKDSCLVM